MKKKFRFAALLLVVVMMCSVMAAAANVGDEYTDNGQYEITSGGATATFVMTDKGEQIKVTYKAEGGLPEYGYYLILFVEGDGTEITSGNIKYIDQKSSSDVNADGSLTFYVFPSDLVSGTILITGTDVDPSTIEGTDTKALGLIAAIVEGKYILGDVNNDGKISAKDAMLIAQKAVNITINGTFIVDAADVNGDGKISAKDAMLIAQKAVGIITAFPAQK